MWLLAQEYLAVLTELAGKVERMLLDNQTAKLLMKCLILAQEYLKLLTELVGKVERVFVIGTPLAQVANEEWRAAYKVPSMVGFCWAFCGTSARSCVHSCKALYAPF